MSTFNAAWVRWSDGWHLVGETVLANRRAYTIEAPHVTSIDVAERLGQADLERKQKAETNVKASLAVVPGEAVNIYRGWRPGDQVTIGSPGVHGTGGVGDVVVEQATMEQGASGRLEVTPQFESLDASWERAVNGRLRARKPGFMEAAAGAQSEVRAEDQTIFEGPSRHREVAWGQATVAVSGELAASPQQPVEKLSRLVRFDVTMLTPPTAGIVYVGVIAPPPFSWRITRDFGEFPMAGIDEPIQLAFTPGRYHAMAMVYDCVLQPWQNLRFATAATVGEHGADHLTCVATLAEETR